MRRVDYGSKFKRDVKREYRSPNNKYLDEELNFVLNLLCLDEPLPKKFHDHALSGKFLGKRECHIKPDLLLIYIKVGKEIIYLDRLGSHAEVFG
jgi:mRNA interferase YafQ